MQYADRLGALLRPLGPGVGVFDKLMIFGRVNLLSKKKLKNGYSKEMYEWIHTKNGD